MSEQEKQTTLKGIVSPSTYREMSLPFENMAEVDTAIEGFFGELYELRKKWRIKDALVIAEVGVKTDDGEGCARLSIHVGNQLLEAELAAFALGQARERVAELVRESEVRGQKSVRRRK
jgi:hypothetical protein